MNRTAWCVSMGLLLVSAWVVTSGYGRQASEPDHKPAINPGVLPIPFGPRATIDGEASTGEWATATLVNFSFVDVFGDLTTAKVRLMHDGGSLYVMYSFEPSREGIWHSPDLFLDTDNDKSSTFRSDDWWFHVSGSDCAASGRYDDYSTCTWSADWETGPRPSERKGGAQLVTFEIRIPFSKLGVAAGSEIGVGLRVEQFTEVSGEEINGTAFWPPGGSPDSPVTWETAQLLPERL